MTTISIATTGITSATDLTPRELEGRLKAVRRKAEGLGESIKESREANAKSLMEQLAALADELLFVATLAAARGDTRMSAGIARQAEGLMGMAEGLAQEGGEELKQAAGRLVQRTDAIAAQAERAAQKAGDEAALSEAERIRENLRERGRKLLGGL